MPNVPSGRWYDALVYYLVLSLTFHCESTRGEISQIVSALVDTWVWGVGLLESRHMVSNIASGVT